MAEITPTNPLADATAFLEQEADIPVDADTEATEDTPVAEGIGTSPSGDEPALETKTEEVKAVEPPKVEEKLTPQMEAVARKERRLQEERSAIKADRDALTQERTAWAAERESYENLERVAKTDLVAMADKVKMAPEDRQRLAIELWNSAQPEGKQPPNYREQAKTRTQAQELADRLARLEAENKQHQARLQESQQRAKMAEISENITASVEGLVSEIADKAPYLAALIKHDRNGVKEDLFNLVRQAYTDDPDTEITPAILVERYEPLLAAKYEPIKRIFGNQPAKSNHQPEAESKKPPKTLSADRVATPTKARTEPKSEEDLIRDAAAFLESRR